MTNPEYKMKYLIYIIGLISLLFAACTSGSEKEVLAYIEQAQEQFEAEKYNEAIISYSKAEAMASRMEDDYRLGLIYHGMARTYKATFGYFEEISYLKKAAEHFSKADKPFSSRNVMYESGLASLNCKDYVAAEEMLRKTLSESHQAADTLMEAKCLQAYSALCVEIPHADPASAIRMLTRVTNELNCTLTSDDRGVLAYSYSLLGNKTEAEKWLSRAAKTAQSAQEIANVRLRDYQINSKLGKTKDALSALEAVVNYNNSSEQMMMKRSVAAAREDFLKQQSEIAHSKFRVVRLWIAVVAMMFLAIVFAITGFFRFKRLQDAQIIAEEKAETEKYISIAEDLQNKLKNADINKVVVKKGGADSKNNILERLCEQYYIYEGTENLQSKILKEVKSVIEGLREDPKSLENLVNSLNDSYNNVVLRLRNQLPQLKDEDVKLFVFVASGFSSTTISTILEKDKGVIYNRIYRLKGKIASSEAENKAEFLGFLTN